MADTTAPVHTRPRDRRQTILATAARLFAERGYHNVSTGDVADAVGVGASALYRHVRNKQELLEQAAEFEFEPIRDALRAAAPADARAAIDVLAAEFGSRRHAGLLWSRESRHLGEPARARVRSSFFDVRDTLVRLIGADDPHALLRAMAIIAALTSPAYHRTPLSHERLIAIITGLARAALYAPVPATGPAPDAAAPPGVAPASRPAEILDAATRLFSTRGYQTVTMHDIGASVGVTSASLYRHYPAKGDLLTAITTRGSEALHVGLGRALASSATPAQALGKTVDAYVDFAFHHGDLLGVLVAEIPNVPEASRDSIRRAERDYVSQWITLLQDARPALDKPLAAFHVHAALTVINDISRTRSLAARSTTPPVAAALATSQLWGA